MTASEQATAGKVPVAENLPTVLMFQPTRFEVVAGDQLQEWETLLREEVGLKGVSANQKLAAATPSVSLCGTPEKRDDCDQI